jgi:hypothetical protein
MLKKMLRNGITMMEKLFRKKKGIRKTILKTNIPYLSNGTLEIEEGTINCIEDMLHIQNLLLVEMICKMKNSSKLLILIMEMKSN